MTHEILEHEDVLRELQARLLRLHNSYGQMISDKASYLTAVDAATRWAAVITYDPMAAQRVLDHLVSSHERATTGWWSSPLGRAVAWCIGIPVPDGHELIPTALVEAALGVSKQRAHELRRAGRAVTQEQIRDEMRGRWPR